jgi:PAS domain S-box-containing protein
MDVINTTGHSNRPQTNEQLRDLLEKSERHARMLQTTLSSITDFAYAFDLDGRFVFVNQALLDLWGLQLKDALGKNFYDLNYPEDLAARLQNQIQLVVKTKQTVKDETPYTNHAGLTGYYEYIFNPVFAPDGSVEMVAGSTRDISERKRVIDRLRDTKARLDSTLTAAEVATWTWEIQRDLVVADKNSELFFSVTPEEAAGAPIARYVRAIHPADRPRVENAIAEALKKGSYETEYRLVKPDGSFRWVVARGHVEYDGNGRPARFPGVLIDITERKQAEENLRENEARFRALLTATSDVLYRMSPDWSEMLQLHGSDFLAGTEKPSRTWLQDYIHPDDQPQVKAAIQKAIRARSVFEFEHRVRRADGTLGWTFSRAVPLFDAHGEITEWFGAATDVTERKQAEEALRNSEAQRSAIIRQAPLGIYLVDSKMRIVEVNPTARPVFGNLEDLIGRDFDEVVHILWPKETADDVMSHFHHTLATGDPYIVKGFSQDRIDRNAEEHYDWELHRITLPDGTYGAVVYFIDISAHVLAGQKIKETEARFHQMADNIPPMAWMTDEHGAVFWYNKRWYDYTGSTFEEMQGWGWQKVMDPNELQRTLPKWKNALASGDPWEDVFRVRRYDGQWGWFLSRAFPLRDAEGKITRWFGTNTDITESRKIQEALRLAQEQLSKHAAGLEQTVAERTIKLREALAELESYSYSIAHDMRAPLRAMQGFSSLLLEDYAHGFSPDALHYLQRIAKSAERLDRLIQDVLTYSKIMSGEMDLQPVQPEPLLREIVESYPNLHSSKAEIVLQEPLPPVLANSAALTQVFSNLLGNAVKFVKPGTQPRVIVRAEQGNGSVRFWFEDNGIGMPPEASSRIFQMFQTLNQPGLYEGTGLGLAIVRKALTRMDGAVGVESVPGQGSRFWVDLRSLPNPSSGLNLPLHPST